jgi:predicted PurR-regulated permease PerM
MENLNLKFRTVKIADIGYVFIIQFVLAFVLSILLDKVYGKFDAESEETKSKSTLRLSVESLGQVFVAGVIFYVMRNIIELIPSPITNIAGYQHDPARLKELGGASIFPLIFLFFQTNMMDRLGFIRRRVLG